MNSLHKILVTIVILSFLSNFAIAATVHGNIYDLSLNKVKDAIVEVDTTPNQYYISKNGSYYFNIPWGKYTLKAEKLQKGLKISSTNESIVINQDGDYIVDLILFPDFESEDELSEDIEIDTLNGDINYFQFAIEIIVAILLIIVGILYTIKKLRHKHKKTESDEMVEDVVVNKIIHFIKEEDGRTTQKDIRKKIPLSEAKISLVIAELEHKGVIEKIKKGRGNIIVLKKR